MLFYKWVIIIKRYLKYLKFIFCMVYDDKCKVVLGFFLYFKDLLFIIIIN